MISHVPSAVFTVDLLHAYSKHMGAPHGVRDLVEKAQKSKPNGARTSAPRTARQLRPDEIEQLLAHYQQHGSVVSAAKALGVTRQTAGKHLADAGVSTLRRMTAAEIDEARSKHAAGASAAAIGRQLGISTNTVIKAVTQAR